MYDCDEKMMATLDELERTPQVYIRSEVSLEYYSGPLVEAYFLTNHRPELLDKTFLSDYYAEVVKVDSATNRYVLPKDRPKLTVDPRLKVQTH